MIAPTGCLQYHVGVRETIKSFNFEGTKLDYNPCWNGTELDCGRRVWTGNIIRTIIILCFNISDYYQIRNWNISEMKHIIHRRTLITYNLPLTGHLNNLDYHVCVKGAEGYCGIMYSPTGPESFFLTGQGSFNHTEETTNLVSEQVLKIFSISGIRNWKFMQLWLIQTLPFLWWTGEMPISTAQPATLFEHFFFTWL